MAFITSVAADCILEAMARTRPLKAAVDARGGDTILQRPEGYGAVLGTDADDSMSPDDRKRAELQGQMAAEGASLMEPWVVGEDRVEMPQLCRIFLGERGAIAYTVSVILYIFVSLWAYAVLVAQTFSLALPLGGDGDDDTGSPSDPAAMALFSYWSGALVKYFHVPDCI